jgi:hypothetical protein
LRFREKTGRFEVILASTGTKGELSAEEMVEWNDARKPAMGEKLDHRRLTLSQKKATWVAAGSAVIQTASGQLLEGPELTLAWEKVRLRGFQAGDRFSAGQLVYLEPHQTVAALPCWQNRAEQPALAEEQVAEMRAQLTTATTEQAACLILCPVQAGGPDHWAALILCRQAEANQFLARHFDSLREVHKECRRQAELTLECLLSLGVPAQAELPPTELPVHQGDGWVADSQ